MTAKFWTRDKAAVRCGLCPHGCVIKDGETGLCLARRNTGGELIAESYGKISAIALDPIEKKPLRRFYPGSYILSVGSYGCNMSCGFCQNSGISQSLPRTENMPPEALAELAKSQRGNLGVAFTYNEPLIGIEYILDTAPLLRAAGLKTVLVTNGMIAPEPLEELLLFTDAMNIDVKSFDKERYRELGGDLETVMRTVERSALACHVEATALIVPGANDGEAEMEALSFWLASVSPDIALHITRFFPKYKMADAKPTSAALMRALADTAKKALRHVYLGNV